MTPTLQAFKAMPQQPSVEVNRVHVRSIAETDSVIAKAGRETRSGLIAPADVFIVRAREAILKSATSTRYLSFPHTDNSLLRAV